jgi:hypothetical protein
VWGNRYRARRVETELVEQESRQDEWSGGRLKRAEIISGADTNLGSNDRVIRAEIE